MDSGTPPPSRCPTISKSLRTPPAQAFSFLLQPEIQLRLILSAIFALIIGER